MKDRVAWTIVIGMTGKESKKISHYFYNYILSCYYYPVLKSNQSYPFTSSVTACILLGPICSALYNEYSWAIHQQSVTLQEPGDRPSSEGKSIILRCIHPDWAHDSKSLTLSWNQALLNHDRDMPLLPWVLLTHWGWDKMAAFSQMTLSNAFSWIKILEFRLKIHWSLFLRVL